MDSVLRKLPEQAERWPLVDDPAYDRTRIREASMGRRPDVYRILDTFDAERVIVHRVPHGAQDDLAEEGL